MEYDRIVDQLRQGMVNVVGSEERLEAAALANASRVKGQKESIEQRLKEVTTKRANLAHEQDRVISWARKGFINEKQLERQLRAISTESEQYAAEQNRLLADLRLIGDGDAVYRQAREFIPMMKARINDHLSEDERQEIVDSLVHRALLNGAGDLTIEFKIPHPEMSFGYFSS